MIIQRNQNSQINQNNQNNKTVTNHILFRQNEKDQVMQGCQRVYHNRIIRNCKEK